MSESMEMDHNSSANFDEVVECFSIHVCFVIVTVPDVC